MTKAILFTKRWMLVLVGLICLVGTVTPVQAMETEDLAAVVWNTSLSLRIGFLEDGAKLHVLEAGSRYHRIDCYDMEGYIRAALVEEINREYYVNCKNETTDVKTVDCREMKDTLSLRGQISQLALAQQGIPYVYGGTGRGGFDCSGFVQYVYGHSGVPISRVVTTQLNDGLIVSSEAMLPGDLVVFENTYDLGPSHIGIYLGDNKFIHASSSRGVIVSDLEEAYYAEHFLCARRVLVMEYLTLDVKPLMAVAEQMDAP